LISLYYVHEKHVRYLSQHENSKW